MTIYFDMDGTIADLYGVENWLSYLLAEDSTPYAVAKPMVNMNLLARYLNKVSALGYEIGIISWGSKNSSTAYLEKVTTAKLKWLKKHLPTVHFHHIHIVEYGTNKYELVGGGILFDDEQRNRDAWGNGAYEPKDIIKVLKEMVA